MARTGTVTLCCSTKELVYVRLPCKVHDIKKEQNEKNEDEFDFNTRFFSLNKSTPPDFSSITDLS